MIAPALANQLLSREAWARERLGQHAGRTFAVGAGPLTTSFSIDASGMLATPRDDRAADVTLRIAALDVPSLLADPSRWNALVEAEGDGALAATLADLAQTLPWFVERTLASALGPIVGQRAADAGRALLRLPSYAASRVADAVASYATDEARIATRGIELQRFVDQVGAVAARTDALERRLDDVAARAAFAAAVR
jgi:ubiquinone biosynthesis protein UbiJ